MFLFSQCDGFAEPDDSSATTGAYSGKQLAIIIKIFFSFLLDFTSINSLYYLIVPILSISLNSIRKTRIDIAKYTYGNININPSFLRYIFS